MVNPDKHHRGLTIRRNMYQLPLAIRRPLMEPWGVVNVTVKCVGGEEADTRPVLVRPQVFCGRGDRHRMNGKKNFVYCLLLKMGASAGFPMLIEESLV